MPEQQNVSWKRSTLCDSGACVEVAFVDDAVWVRRSEAQDNTVLSFTRVEWNAFVEGVMNGEFRSE